MRAVCMGAYAGLARPPLCLAHRHTRCPSLALTLTASKVDEVEFADADAAGGRLATPCGGVASCGHSSQPASLVNDSQSWRPGQHVPTTETWACGVTACHDPPASPRASLLVSRAVASMVIVKMECERELSWFMSVAPTTRFFLPACGVAKRWWHMAQVISRIDSSDAASCHAMRWVK